MQLVLLKNLRSIRIRRPVQRVEELVQMIEAAGFTVDEVVAGLRDSQQEVETQQEAETV